MTVRFHIPKFFRRYAGDKTELALEGATLRAALEDLVGRYPDLRLRIFDKHGAIYPYLVLFLNDAQLDREALDTPLADGDRLELIGAAVGGAPEASEHDVRMRGFRARATFEAACALAWGEVAALDSEAVAVTELAGRVLAEDCVSAVAIPPFRRSAMDGYAIRAEDSHGASELTPLRLRVIGEVLPGRAFAGEVGPGEALRIMTGAPVPEGADAVIKAEDTRLEGEAIALTAALSPGKNIGRIGEDILPEQLLLSAGRRLRPQDIGVLASVGQAQVRCVRRPRVRLLITGDELLPPGATPTATRIVDSNSPMLAALIARDGAQLERLARLPDDREAIAAALRAPCEDGAPPEVIVATGGTSVGREDWLPVLLRELGELPVHGVATRPAAPTGIGRIGPTRVFLLPGNPVSCLAGYDLFAGPCIRKLGGRPAARPYRTARGQLARRIVSQVGRVDYVRVTMSAEGLVTPLAVAGASILSSTTRADGFLLTPEGSEGLAEASEVTVELYEPL